MSADITVRRLSAEQAANCIDDLADVLIDCVTGGASVSFMLPLPRETAVAFWRNVAHSVACGERMLFAAEDKTGKVVGTVQMILSQPENQPHRADIAKMLVHRKARRRGIAQRLLTEIEEEGRKEGKSVLVLDTVTGGDAERVYLRAGWQRVDTIPMYAQLPSGELSGTTFFYKHLSR